MLLGAPGIATSNKKLLGAPGLTTRSKDATSMVRNHIPYRCRFTRCRTYWGLLRQVGASLHP